MTHLIDTLFSLEKYLGIEIDTLYPFAEGDTIGGYHPDETQRKWDVGAIWGVEGQIIYALIRALKPLNCVEIGSGRGCATNHIADALHANGVGHLTTIDRGNTPTIHVGLEDLVTVLPGDAIEWLMAKDDNSIDFIFEDGDHSEDACHAIGELAKRKLRPGGVLVAHDAAHFMVGQDVTGGFDRAGLSTYRVYLTEPSDCGLLVWQKEPAEIEEPVLQAQEDEPSPKAKPTRKRATKKAAK
jgi:predicted O-methyltransferase YrrM